MGLDAFKSDSSDSGSKDEKSNPSNDDENTNTTEKTTNVDSDIDTGVKIPEDSTGSDPDVDYYAQYEEERFKECFRCGSRKVLIRWLSNLGNIWFCQNGECIDSVKHHCEVVASPKQIAKELDYELLHSKMENEKFNPENMTLEDFKAGSTGQSSSENKRKSQMFTKERFEEVLAETEYSWEIKDYDWTNEWVYEVGSGKGKFVMRVYSSVDKRSNESREKDSDAIRLVVLHEETNKPVLSEKRTNRIKTWPKNLKQKISNIEERRNDLEWCGECSSVMLIRENSQSGEEFYGCSSYPECTNTKPMS